MNQKIAAVVVTHNRMELLKKCLAALRGQTRRPDKVVVVDNGSTDGTENWLATQHDLSVLRQENQGSAGGQATGAEWALEHGFDWVWLMDDDTIPEPEALAALINDKCAKKSDTGLLASLVLWRDGTLHVMNMPYPAQYPEIVDYLADPSRTAFPIKSASFVSILVKCDVIRRVGLPLRGTFLWGDDLEFTRRITSVSKGYCVVLSRVMHDTPGNAGSELNVNEQPLSLKQYCLIRNLFILALFSCPSDFKRLLALVKRAAQFMKQAYTWRARGNVLRIAADSWQFVQRNKSFCLPLMKHCPKESQPVCWPRICRS